MTESNITAYGALVLATYVVAGVAFGLSTISGPVPPVELQKISIGLGAAAVAASAPWYTGRWEIISEKTTE